MRSVLTPLRVIRYSATNAWADMWVMYTPLTWTVGWLGRVAMQVVFFALIGLLLDSAEALRFLFIGNAVMITAIEAMICVASSTWERRQGTLPLLVAAPSRLWPVFVGRSVEWLPSGVATASFALFVVGPVFGVTWTFVQALAVFGCIVVVAVTTYFFGLALAALVLAAMRTRNLVSNVAYTLMMLICGVMVPLTFWPGWVQAIAQSIPLTHGLAAIRALVDPADHTASEAVAGVLLALGVGLAWMLVAALLLEKLASAGRRTGSIEFSD